MGARKTGLGRLSRLARRSRDGQIAFDADGRLARAEQEAREAVAQRRVAAEDGSEASRAGLAAALGTLATRLATLRLHDRAVLAAEEAVLLYRQLASADEAAFGAELAEALTSLSSHLLAAGQWQRALAVADEAVAEARAQAAADPACSPALARALWGQAAAGNELGAHEAAVAISQEAHEIWRELSATQPAAFTRDLARSLALLSNYRSLAGQDELALRDVEDAAALYRDLAAHDRSAHLGSLASALGNVARCRMILRRLEQALAAADDAIELHRENLAQQPDADRGGLAITLNVKAGILMRLERWEVVDATAEATRMGRDLAAGDPVAWRPRFASMLDMHAAALAATGQHWKSLQAAEEGVALHRELEVERPAQRGELADALRGLATVRRLMLRHEDALEASEEAAGIYRELREEGFAVAPGDLAAVLRISAECLERAGRHDEAARRLEEVRLVLGARAETESEPESF